MRVLRIADYEASVEGRNVPAWVAERLQQAGFDLSRHIIYRYDSPEQETVFLQYAQRWEAARDGADWHRTVTDGDSDYSTKEAWDEALDALIATMEQKERAS